MGLESVSLYAEPLSTSAPGNNSTLICNEDATIENHRASPLLIPIFHQVTMKGSLALLLRTIADCLFATAFRFLANLRLPI